VNCSETKNIIVTESKKRRWETNSSVYNEQLRVSALCQRLRLSIAVCYFDVYTDFMGVSPAYIYHCAGKVYTSQMCEQF